MKRVTSASIWRQNIMIEAFTESGDIASWRIISGYAVQHGLVENSTMGRIALLTLCDAVEDVGINDASV